MGLGIGARDKMAKRAAKEIKVGMTVNLGIGIPSLVPNHLPKDLRVMFQAENGILGSDQVLKWSKLKKISVMPEVYRLLSLRGLPIVIVLLHLE